MPEILDGYAQCPRNRAEVQRLRSKHPAGAHCYRFQEPHIRVRVALERITRDRWICYADWRRIGEALARCAGCEGHDATRTTHAAIRDGAPTAIGLLRGEAPFRVQHPGYRAALRALNLPRTPSSAKAELIILNIALRYGAY